MTGKAVSFCSLSTAWVIATPNWSPDCVRRSRCRHRPAGEMHLFRRLKSLEANGLAVTGIQCEADSEDTEGLGVERDAELAAIDRLESRLAGKARDHCLCVLVIR